MTRDKFREVMAERRMYKRKGPRWHQEVAYLTRTARTYYFAIKNVPPMQWDEMLKEKMK